MLFAYFEYLGDDFEAANEKETSTASLRFCRAAVLAAGGAQRGRLLVSSRETR